jgi:sulfide:quinone oxidoreductase
MDKIIHITPSFAVTSELRPNDFAEAARLGFKAIICNRPDGEEDGQLTGRQAAVHAWRAGLTFQHIPATKHELFTDGVVDGVANAVARLDAPVLAYCKSGIRSAIAWAAASARTESVDNVLAALGQAGFDLDFLRDDLEQQAGRRHWLGGSKAAERVEEGDVAPLEAA